MEKHLHYFGFTQGDGDQLPYERVCECGLRYAIYIQELRDKGKKTEDE